MPLDSILTQYAEPQGGAPPRAPDVDPLLAKYAEPEAPRPARRATYTPPVPAVDPQLDSFVNDVIAEAAKRTGYTYKLGSGGRTPAEQAEKVAQGYSRTYNSKHLTGHGRDVMAYDEQGNYITDGSHKAYTTLGDVFRERGDASIKWGGDFQSFYDPSHFELADVAPAASPGGPLDPLLQKYKEPDDAAPDPLLTQFAEQPDHVFHPEAGGTVTVHDERDGANLRTTYPLHEWARTSTPTDGSVIDSRGVPVTTAHDFAWQRGNESGQVTLGGPVGPHFKLTDQGWEVTDEPPDFRLPEQRIDPDEVVRVNAQRAGTPAAQTSAPLPALPARPDPYTAEGRAERDQRAQAERQPDARLTIDLNLPAGVSGWDELSSNQLAQTAARQFAATHGIDADYTERWLAEHGHMLKAYDLHTGAPVTGVDAIASDAYDGERRTLRVSAEMPHLAQLQHDYEAERGPVDRAVDWFNDDTHTAGEKALDVAAPIVQTAAQAVARPFAALDAQFFSRVNRPGIANKIAAANPLDPQALGAAYSALVKGETPDDAKNPIAERVRRDVTAPGTVGAAHPQLAGLTSGVVELLTSPSTWVGLGELGTGAKAVRGLPLVRRVEQVLTAGRDARAAEFFAGGGRVLNVERAAAEAGEVPRMVVTLRTPEGALLDVDTATGASVNAHPADLLEAHGFEVKRTPAPNARPGEARGEVWQVRAPESTRPMIFNDDELLDFADAVGEHARAPVADGAPAALGTTGARVDLADVRRFRGRDIVRVELPDGTVQPFYRSTGRNSGQAGRWFPFDDVRESDAWFNKTRFSPGEMVEPEHPLHRFGSEEMRAIADELGRAPVPAGADFAYRDAAGVNHWLDTGAPPVAAPAVLPPPAPAPEFGGPARPVEQLDPVLTRYAEPAPVAESPETVRAQFKSAIDPQSPRAAVLVTPGERAPRLTTGFAKLKLEGHGTLYVNRAKARALGIAPRDLEQYVATHGFEPLIGKVEPVVDTSRGLTLRTEDATGRELSSSVVETPEGAAAQAAVDRAQFPQAQAQTVMPTETAAGRRAAESVGAPPRGGRTRARRVVDTTLDVAAAPKTLMSAGDLSAAGRQGLIFSLTEPGAGLRAMRRQVKSLVSQSAHDDLFRWLATHPDADLAERSGLYSAMKAHAGATLTGREDAFMSRIAGRLPVVKQSERAYVAYLDSLRQDVFSKYARELERAGMSFETHPEEYRSIARFINSATGRGELPAALEKFAPALNATMFAPHNLKGRFDVLNPVFYAQMSPAARKIAARKMLQFVGTVSAGMYLAHLAGAKVTLNSADPDFGKVVVGKTHLDFTGGHRSIIRLIAQLGQTFAHASNGELADVSKKAGGLLLGFLRKNSAPVVNYGAAAATGKEVTGEPFEWLGHLHKDGKFAPGGGVIDRTLFFMLQDLFDAFAAEGGRGVAKAAPAAVFGIGVQTYQPKGRPRRGESVR